MTSTASIIERAEALLRPILGERLRTGFPLAPLTTFRIGGPAALYVEPESLGDLEAVAAAVTETQIPVVIVGKGSNVLVSDTGYDGLVLRLGRGFRTAARHGDQITAGGSMPVPALAGIAAQHGLAGLEFGAAIPASLGGAVMMNAGAHDRSMSEVVDSVDVFDLTQGIARTVTGQAAGFSYRRSQLEGVVIGSRVQLVAGVESEIRALMDEARDWRRATQPLAEPNCGSVFKNPPGDAAARLIESVGGKDIQAGGAHISGKHANFIIAEPGAMAEDVIAVIRTVQDRVRKDAGVELEPEVHLIGEFSQTPH